MTIPILLFILGLVLIILGGDKFVDAAVEIAKSMNISEIIIGATIVSLGTTLPEVLVSVTAAFSGSADICVGNSFGSIICNTSLIAAITQLVRPSDSVDRSALSWRTYFFFAAAVIVFAFGMGMGYFGLPLGLLLIGLFIFYVWFNIKGPSTTSKSSTERHNAAPVKISSLIKPIAILIVTAAMLFVGARLLVDNGIILAEAIGVPERVIGVTFIALGTSLPELVTAITSLIKGHADVSVGNIIGANLLNLLLVIGIPAAICGITPSVQAIRIDLPIAVLVMAVLLVPMIIRKKGSRLQGLILLGSYCAYCFLQF